MRIIAVVAVLMAAHVPPASPVGAVAPRSVAVVNASTSAAEMNARTTEITGLGDLFDGFRTAPLEDGRWLSFTGDATAEDGQVWPVYDNAAVVWDQGTQRRVQSLWPGGHFFPRWPDGSEFWPGQFLVSGTQVYVIGSRVKTYPGVMQWTALGAYGATVEVPAGGDPLFLRYWPTPSSGLDDTAVQWSGAIAADDSYVYVHGLRDRPDAYHARDGGYVARVPLGWLEIPHRWQFWTGSTWSRYDDNAVPTIPLGAAGTNGTSSAYTLHRTAVGEWQVTTKRGGDLASGLGRYVAPSPWGPWSWQQLLPDSAVCSMDCYLTGAAPGIPTTSGQLLVQWSRTNSSPVWAEVPQ
ncbi:DUF4185 domain-containing protein [Micromonospora sp. 4G55]|uniref:DUF4185 domain-containing protein n=1 Tax=Micromonospora sp. 4G55 TaxID=2806102 RepID=UPI001A5E76BA|nr:DUF4185 domain-containing protein [Micromonospora sp. 4G55]MBM0257040.1 hypothetical protein [Micromonospora sp. 4G55]